MLKPGVAMAAATIPRRRAQQLLRGACGAGILWMVWRGDWKNMQQDIDNNPARLVSKDGQKFQHDTSCASSPARQPFREESVSLGLAGDESRVNDAYFISKIEGLRKIVEAAEGRREHAQKALFAMNKTLQGTKASIAP
eukprot:760403-Hanusia_phi.AAC.5